MINLTKNLNSNPELIQAFEKIIANYSPHFNEVINSDNDLNEIIEYGKKISKSNNQLCIVGLGGSSLGTKALYDALGSDNKIIFFDNVDPVSFGKKFNQIDQSNCHWLFISKSGSTKEVLVLIDLIIQKQVDFKPSVSCTIITGEQPSSLNNWGLKNNVKIFYIPDDIGGRFSVFTPVGLVPLAFMGKDLAQVKEGVSWALSQVELIADICSSLVDSFSRGEWVHLYWIYSDSLQSFGLWLQQLWMESLGKKEDLHGAKAKRVSSLFTARGSSDQHSILQQVSEGAKDKLVIFLGDKVMSSYGDKLMPSLFPENDELLGFGLGKLCSVQMKSTYEALSLEAVSAQMLEVDKVSTKSLTALMTIYMTSTIVIANYLNIDPFNQPGVESSKQQTKEILSRLSK